MRIDTDGREYARWTITADADDLTYEVQLDDGDWHQLEPADGAHRLLVAGPDAAGESAVVLTPGRHRARIRCTDNPEIVVRDAGVIDVV